MNLADTQGLASHDEVTSLLTLVSWSMAQRTLFFRRSADPPPVLTAGNTRPGPHTTTWIGMSGKKHAHHQPDEDLKQAILFWC